jgi:hypothetical protein
MDAAVRAVAVRHEPVADAAWSPISKQEIFLW